MRPSLVTLKSVRIPTPVKELRPYEIPQLSNIKYTDLPNTGFGINNYAIPQTKFKHWPVYLKIQNTKITTEIKRIQGDINQFKSDLLALNPKLEITVNSTVGYVNVKGNVVDEVKEYLEKYVGSSTH